MLRCSYKKQAFTWQVASKYPGDILVRGHSHNEIDNNTSKNYMFIYLAHTCIFIPGDVQDTAALRNNYIYLLYLGEEWKY